MNTPFDLRAAVGSRLLLCLVLCFVLMSACRKDDDEGGNPGPVSDTERLEQRVHELVNAHRATVGATPLKYNDLMRDFCRKHSQNMAARRVPFGHQGFEQRMDTIRRTIAGTGEAGENVARLPFTTVDETAQNALQMWLNSPPHRGNIENRRYNLTGVGASIDTSGQVFLTQKFMVATNP